MDGSLDSIPPGILEGLYSWTHFPPPHFALEPPGDPEKGTRSGTSHTSSQSTLQPAPSITPKPSPSTSSKDPQRQLPPRGRTAKYIQNQFTTYRQIFAVIFIVNLTVLIVLVSVSSGNLIATRAGDAAAVNLAVGVLFRQEQVINVLFQVMTSLPRSWPLSIRAGAAKVFHYGGVHSGCGVAAVTWFLLYTALATKDYIESPSRDSIEALATAWLLVALFMLLVGAAYPSIRIRFHNTFEIFHRFAGWAALGVFWAHVLFSAHSEASRNSLQMGGVLVRSISFWSVLVATLPIVVSWAQLRRWKVTADRLSDHATRLYFEHGEIDTCFGIRVSTNPLLEWHSFATIPGAACNSKNDLPAISDGNSGSMISHNPQTSHLVLHTHAAASLSNKSSYTVGALRTKPAGFSVLISHAGDWTHRAIHSPPSHLWTRGSPTRGVIYAARLFNRVVIVTTGSGIGPCLSLLVTHRSILPSTPRVIWSAPAPEQTFGPGIICDVKLADPSAVIWDTRVKGRPNLISLAANLVKESNAEAVFIISNPKVCKSVVTGLESLGINAYAPIFDS